MGGEKTSRLIAGAMRVRFDFGALLFSILFLAQTACASIPAGLSAELEKVQPGSVVIVAESHGFAPHHDNQVAVLNALAKQNLKISVGMEFFDISTQSAVDSYLDGKLSEPEFLNAVGWGKTPFSFYRRQTLFPAAHEGTTIALNAPREITSIIAKSGLKALTSEQRAILPKDFSLGNEGYRERFNLVMGRHVPANALDRYFEAQSVWDEVMATTAVDFIARNPDQVLVIMVGDFHASYGGGLPDRLSARGQKQILVISQINANEIDPNELQKEIEPHPVYGPRADFVWVSR